MAQIEILEQRPNFTVIGIGNKRIYFSYKTPVAFYAPGYGLVVSQNIWSNTTGKHLNFVDQGRKADRVSNVDFELALEEAFAS